MKTPLILFLVTAVVPVFFGRTRSAPFWLALQAVALGWAAANRQEGWSGHTIGVLLEVLVVRAVLVPQLLRYAILGRDEPNRDLMPPNLLVWAVAVALVALAFEFGAPETSDWHALALGTVGATVTVAMLLLAANTSPLAQLTALLFIENALALFELMLPEAWPLPVHMALSAIYLLTAGVAAWLIGRPERETPVPGAPGAGASS